MLSGLLHSQDKKYKNVRKQQGLQKQGLRQTYHSPFKMSFVRDQTPTFRVSDPTDSALFQKESDPSGLLPVDDVLEDGPTTDLWQAP
jgi:hypothetical protein